MYVSQVLHQQVEMVTPNPGDTVGKNWVIRQNVESIRKGRTQLKPELQNVVDLPPNLKFMVSPFPSSF